MPAITTYTDYTAGETVIAQVENVDFRNNLNWFIAKYEKDYLTRVLGSTLYNSFMAALSLDPIPVKWTLLREKVKNSLVNYVYYRYQDDNITKTVGTGEKKPLARNAEVASVRGKMVRAWNEMVNETRDNVEWLHLNAVDYPHEDWDYCKCDELCEHINQLDL